MRRTGIIWLCALAALLLAAPQSRATEMEKTYLSRLQAIQTVPGDGDNTLFTLLSESSAELDKDWSPRLAQELARVFNALLDVNQNYFLVELLDPMARNRARQFSPILDKALSAKNKAAYRQMRKMDRDEELNGNG